MQNLLKDAKIIKASSGATAGTSEVDSSIVDMGNTGGAGGFDAILWIVDLGTVTAGSVLTAQPQNNTANSTSGMANCATASTYTDSAGESSNTMLLTDVVVSASARRYHRLKLTRTTSNAVINTIIAVLYRSKDRPVTLDASVIASALSVASA